MVAGRPLSVADYRNASTITHDYDAPVLTEGIRSVLAVPVIVDGLPRADALRRLPRRARRSAGGPRT